MNAGLGNVRTYVRDFVADGDWAARRDAVQHPPIWVWHVSEQYGSSAMLPGDHVYVLFRPADCRYIELLFGRPDDS